MKSRFAIIALLMFSSGTLLTGCGSETAPSPDHQNDSHAQGTHDHDHDHDHEHEGDVEASHDEGQHEHEDHAADEVVWKELASLDALGHTLEALSMEARTKKVLEHQDELIEALEALAASEIPENAKQKAQLQALKSDLASLITILKTSAGSANEREMEKMMISSVPLVESMISLSGVPHKHATVHTHDDGTSHSHLPETENTSH